MSRIEKPHLVTREMGTKAAVGGGRIVPLCQACEWLRHQVGFMESYYFESTTKGGVRTSHRDQRFHLIGWGKTAQEAEAMALRHPLMAA